MIRFRDDTPERPQDLDPEAASTDDALDHEAEASVDDTYRATCPHCFEENELAVDMGGGESQSYVEDCQVCCRPWQVRVEVDDEGRVRLELEPLDE
ncbi:MAG: CPXCG motif-containing cysteine-rich protein [Candidatus Eisenbacteria bacterium]